MSDAANPLWRVLQSRTIYADPPHIAVSADDVQLPNGRIIRGYYQIASRPSCAVVATDPEGRFVMIRQYKHGARAVCLTFPGGRLEEGETLMETAQRELLEETGCRAEAWRSLGEFPIHANQHVGIVGIFRAENAVAVTEPAHGDLEDMQVVRVARAAALQALGPAGEIRLLGDAAALALALAAEGAAPVDKGAPIA